MTLLILLGIFTSTYLMLGYVDRDEINTYTPHAVTFKRDLVIVELSYVRGVLWPFRRQHTSVLRHGAVTDFHWEMIDPDTHEFVALADSWLSNAAYSARRQHVQAQETIASAEDRATHIRRNIR